MFTSFAAREQFCDTSTELLTPCPQKIITLENTVLQQSGTQDLSADLYRLTSQKLLLLTHSPHYWINSQSHFTCGMTGALWASLQVKKSVTMLHKAVDQYVYGTFQKWNLKSDLGNVLLQ